MKRSEFLKLSCTGCALGTTGILSLTELLSCAPHASMSVYKTGVTDKIISVPESQVANAKITIVRAKGMDYDIALSRDIQADFSNYFALLLRCTHFSNPLEVSGNKFSCN